MKKVYDGLAILLKYEPDGNISVDHDIIYSGGGDPSEMDAEDLQNLENLGWFWNPDFDSWAKNV